jgi:hypothetical protein
MQMQHYRHYNHAEGGMITRADIQTAKATRIIQKALLKQARPVIEAALNWETLPTFVRSLIKPDSLRDAMKTIIVQGQKVGVKSVNIPKKDLWEDLLDQQMMEYAEQVVGYKITWMTAETEKLILGIVRDATSTGISEGWGRDKIARYLKSELSKQYGEIARYRSIMIAQTETTAAVNYGSLTAAKNAGVPMRKIWRAGGADSRPAHLAADGQKVATDTMFNVGGEMLMFPGDSSHGASAGNVINCRCGMYYERVI